MTVELSFSYLRKTQPQELFRERSLNIKRTKKTFWRRIQIREENNLCQILFQINSQSQASKCTKKLTTLQVFYV